MINVLVIDDNESILETIKYSLESLDKSYKVKTINKGSHALAAALKLKPDILILDIMMPNVDGWKVYDELKSKGIVPELPVVFLTGMTEKIVYDKTNEFKAHVMIKPFDPEELDALIKKLVKKRQGKKLLKSRIKKS